VRTGLDRLEVVLEALVECGDQSKMAVIVERVLCQIAIQLFDVFDVLLVQGFCRKAARSGRVFGHGGAGHRVAGEVLPEVL
jgi:hypothetical protein